MTTVSEVTPEKLNEWLGDGGEIAVLDVRDLGAFTRGHLWLAVNLPYARLELRIRRFVPRRSTRIVLCDQDGGLARRAAAALQGMDYDNIAILRGGIAAWRDAGYPLVDGNYVLAHCLGYWLQERCRTATIAPAELAAKIEAGEDLVILDTRPREDHGQASIPGSICAPAAELPRRIRDIAPDPQTQIVVHCGGITRGVIGAQALALAGVDNPVLFLQDGTKGWLAAGLTPQPGEAEAAGQVSTAAQSVAAAAGERIAEQYRLTYITPEELALWRREADRRTTYVVDVRSPEEFKAAHLPGALSIPGGELAGMTIDHLATRNARFCLVADRESGRAEITAVWMLHQGWPEVAILQGWDEPVDLEAGPEPDPAAWTDTLEVPSLSPQDLAARQQADKPLVIDFGASQSHEAGHVPEAAWMLRSQLPDALGEFPKADCYVVTSPKGRIAKVIAAEMKAMTDVPVFALRGGTKSWREAGLDMASGMQRPLCPIDDFDNVGAAPPEAAPGEDQNIHARYNAWRRSLFDRYNKHGLTELRALP